MRGRGKATKLCSKLLDSTATQPYQKLVEFLIILSGEGVRWVWFDAVCINQTDSEEKEHEIQHMGTYYHESEGCYVLQHGIGKGFKLLLWSEVDGKAGQKPLLPRWFSRAWTFQEWVLPAETTFIIDLASEEYLRRIAPIVLLRGNVCFCCYYRTSIDPVFLQECMLSSDKVTEENERDHKTLSSAMATMQTIHSVKHLDFRHFRSVPRKRHWYFADDLGYSFLLRLKLQMNNVLEWDGKENLQEKVLTGLEFDFTKRLGVKQSIETYMEEDKRDLPLVIKEISVRDCSNPEDRVLSVLKLLGVQDAVQVRTGKSLEMQLLQLANTLVVWDKEMLVQLCLVDGFGNETPGMSWMPHFEVKKGSWQEGAQLLGEAFSTPISPLAGFSAEMRCRDVCSMGMLQIEGDVCTGNLICCNQTIKNSYDIFRSSAMVSRSMVLKVQGKVVMYLYAHMFPELAQRSACILKKKRGVIGPDKAYIAFRAPGLLLLRERIPVWLVKVGFYQQRGMQTRYMLWLVCVREAQEGPLHKIGYVLLDRHLNVQKMDCCIGGLGQGISNLLLSDSGA